MAVLSMPVVGSGTPAVGSGPNVGRWAGAFGLAALGVFLVATPLYFIGPAQPAGTTDGGTLADFLTKTSAQVITRTTIADPIIIGCFLVFLAGLRHLIRQARPDYEWLATLVFGLGLALSTLQLVADGMQGAAALDASSRAEPMVVRGLFEASYVFYGAIGLIVAAFMLASAGFAILTTGALPRWIGWLALVGAVVNLIGAPSIYGGTDYTAFYSASGWITYIAQLTWVAWFAIASFWMFRSAIRACPAPSRLPTEQPDQRPETRDDTLAASSARPGPFPPAWLDYCIARSRSTATLHAMDTKAGRVIVLLILAAFIGVMILPFLPS